jgi:hypothetical protein
MTAGKDGASPPVGAPRPREHPGQDLGWSAASYHAEVDKLSRTLAGLTVEDWAIADEHGRTVRALLDELLLLEYTHTTRLAQIGSGAAAQARVRYIRHSHRADPPAVGRAGTLGWAEQIGITELELAHAHRVLVSRLLQTSLTAEAIRALTLRPSDPLPSADLHGVLDVVIHRLAPDLFIDSGRGPRRVEIRLSGPGGGHWVLGPPQEPVSVAISAAAGDFALLVGRRVTVEAMPKVFEGDADLGGRLLAAVPEFAST